MDFILVFGIVAAIVVMVTFSIKLIKSHRANKHFVEMLLAFLLLMIIGEFCVLPMDFSLIKILCLPNIIIASLVWLMLEF